MAGFKRIINVIPITNVKLAAGEIYTYLVPLSLQDQLRPGQLVLVPFGRRQELGITSTFEMHRLPSEIRGMKEITKLLDNSPVLSEQNLSLAKYLSKYYICPLGLVIKAMIPKFSATKKAPAILAYEPSNPDFVLTESQRFALAQITSAQATASTFLLKGQTGTGKTEVFLQAIERVIESGKQAIVLYPEISLSEKAIEKYARRFGALKIALWHSRLKNSEKSSTWLAIREGTKRIVIGTRSAIFSPVQNLGIIIIDEEHDSSYKQSEMKPKYHAMAVASKLSEIWQCPLVLGDATPSVETYQSALLGEIKLLELPHRIKADVTNARIQVIDLKKEKHRSEGSAVLSEYLQLAMLDCLREKKQIVLFMNRRGDATRVVCRDCGFTPKCSRCLMPLVWHTGLTRGFLLCHHCAKKHDFPAICPKCGGSTFRFLGTGTQSVEREVKKFLRDNFSEKKLPEYKRVDMDTAFEKGELVRIHERWDKGKIHLLIATQSVLLDWDISKVGLVGVISADFAIRLPDFRANEKTFQILTQIASRAGGGLKPVSVILQTYQPDNYAIESVRIHSFEKFYHSEIAERKRLGYPPFRKLVKLTSSDPKDIKARARLDEIIRAAATRNPPAEFIGPVPAFLSKVRGKYSYHLFLKLSQGMSEELFEFLRTLPSTVDIDIDPDSLL